MLAVATKTPAWALVTGRATAALRAQLAAANRFSVVFPKSNFPHEE